MNLVALNCLNYEKALFHVITRLMVTNQLKETEYETRISVTA